MFGCGEAQEEQEENLYRIKKKNYFLKKNEISRKIEVCAINLCKKKKWKKVESKQNEYKKIYIKKRIIWVFHCLSFLHLRSKVFSFEEFPYFLLILFHHIISQFLLLLLLYNISFLFLFRIQPKAQKKETRKEKKSITSYCEMERMLICYHI